MLVLALVISAVYLAWLSLSLRVTDPMTFGLDRARHIWIGLITACCASVLSHEAVEKYRTLQIFVRASEKCTGTEEKKSDCEIFADAVTSTAFGDPFRF